MIDLLGEFLAKHDWVTLRRIRGWQVERDIENQDIVRQTLPARDDQLYVVRYVCDGYPGAAPGVKFISESGSESDRSAWPDGDSEFQQVVKLPPSSFLCTDLTREGLAHHPEWAKRPSAWGGSPHTLMELFNYVQRLLKSDHYLQRGY